MRLHNLLRLLLGSSLVLPVLAACVLPPEPAPRAASPVASVHRSPGTSTTIPRGPEPLPLVTATPDGPLSNLTSSQARTLRSLRQVDDYPLYTMTYHGAHGPAFAPADEERTGTSVWACSLFAALAESEDALYGRSFDWRFSPAVLLFADPPDGYASVSMVDIAYFIDEVDVDHLEDLPLAERAPLLEAVFWPFDGLNEKGLAVGMAAVPEQPLPHDPGKEPMSSLGIIREMLDHAADVDEALDLLDKYNLSWGGGPALHYLLADSSGDAALVEFFKGEMVILPKEAPWHLATNHLRAQVAEKGNPGCRRYGRLLERLEGAQGRLGTEDAMLLLADVAQENTQWSVVYGLNSGQVQIAMGRDYAEVHSFSLEMAQH